MCTNLKRDLGHFWLDYIGTSALTPDGGLINGVGPLSRGKHLRSKEIILIGP